MTYDHKTALFLLAILLYFAGLLVVAGVIGG
jgi:hypothetical protein